MPEHKRYNKVIDLLEQGKGYPKAFKSQDTSIAKSFVLGPSQHPVKSLSQILDW